MFFYEYTVSNNFDNKVIQRNIEKTLSQTFVELNNNMFNENENELIESFIKLNYIKEHFNKEKKVFMDYVIHWMFSYALGDRIPP